MQSHSSFDVMIVYKPWEGCKETFDRIKEYSGLGIRLVKQDAGLFEEALNTIYRKADSDVVINTDDDAWASRNWIKDHVEPHRRNKKVGMATGMVNESTLPDGTPLPFLTNLMNRQKWRMNKHTLLDRPIDSGFRGYGMYIGRSGNATVYTFNSTSYPYYSVELVAQPIPGGPISYTALLSNPGSHARIPLSRTIFINQSGGPYSVVAPQLNNTLNYSFVVYYSGTQITGGAITGSAMPESNFFRFTALCDYALCPYNASGITMRVVYQNADTKVIKINYSDNS